MLALGIEDGRVVLVNEATGEEEWAAHAHPNSGRIKVAMSPDFRLVASVGLFDKTWKLWNATSGAVHREGAKHDGTGACICRKVRHGLRILLEGCSIEGHTGGLRAVAFSPCGGGIATAGLDGAVIVWDARTGKEKRRMQGDEEGASFGAAWSLCFSVDGAWLACGNAVGSIQIWNAMTGAFLRTIPLAPKQNSVVSVLFSPTESRSLAAWEEDDQIHLWDIVSGEKIRSIAGGAFAAFSPDGRTIATASATKGSDVQFVDAKCGELLRTLKLPRPLRLTMDVQDASVCSGAFSADGSKFASATYDGTCHVWDSLFGVLIRTIDVGIAVHSLAWGRDGEQETHGAMAVAVENTRYSWKGRASRLTRGWSDLQK